MAGGVCEQGEPGGDVCSVAVRVCGGEWAEVRVKGAKAGTCEEGVV